MNHTVFFGLVFCWLFNKLYFPSYVAAEKTNAIIYFRAFFQAKKANAKMTEIAAGQNKNT